jgi:riboflavin synthase alpha subunit
VSLTVNTVEEHGGQTEISINLIPHTWKKTLFSQFVVGDWLNLEVDPIARQVARVLESMVSSGRWPTALAQITSADVAVHVPAPGPRSLA